MSVCVCVCVCVCVRYVVLGNRIQGLACAKHVLHHWATSPALHMFTQIDQIEDR
jgi:hypothetical protein